MRFPSPLNATAGRSRRPRPPSGTRGGRRCRPSLEALEDRRLLTTYLVTNTNDAGTGSLRQAILDANAHSGMDTIAFNIGDGGLQTIRPLSPLPDVTDPVVIDGTTQPGYNGSPVIELNGAGAGSGGGLHVSAGNSTVKALVINGFAGDGILLDRSGGDLVSGCYIGTNAAGTQAVPNQFYGVHITRAANNTIGGLAPMAGNLISGNPYGGLFVESSDGNQILGNVIGTTAVGTAAVPNDEGIRLSNANNNRVGGTVAGARNLIAGNRRGGLVVDRSSAQNQLLGNFIGTDAAGTHALPNGQDGVQVDGSANTLGGTAPGAGNLVSGNGNSGIVLNGRGNSVLGNFVGTDAAGTHALPNGSGVYSEANNTIGGTAPGAGNLISGNHGAGISISSAGNWVLGNKVGTDAAGANALPNEGAGVEVDGGATNTIGGTTATARNLIAGNRGNGIRVFLGQGNLIQGNYIGTDASGTRALGNGLNGLLAGVSLEGPDNTLGGTVAGASNLISGNRTGVQTTQSAARANLIQGNFIGTDASGNLSISNLIGIDLGDGTGNTVGGTAPGSRNLISGNRLDGIEVFSNGNVVQGNFIGTNAAGTGAVGNDTGVVIGGGVNATTVGGMPPGAGNLISDNRTGLSLNSGGNQVLGNFIGTDPTGSRAVPNQGGVSVAGSGDTIGGTDAGAGNLISGNTNYGISISFSGAGNLIQGNAIGTDAQGTDAIPNGVGVTVSGSDNVLGGADAGAGNLISGNLGYGVAIGSNINSPVRNDLVQGNSIGTDRTGTRALPNRGGVCLCGNVVTGHTIGGTDAGAGNLISGNLDAGITISGGTGNLVLGNIIGADVSGTTPLPNRVGVAIVSALVTHPSDDNLIGTRADGADNLIAGNTEAGVEIGGYARHNAVAGNWVGLARDGASPLPNGGDGVYVHDGASGNTIGGLNDNDGNVVAFNGGSGVRVEQAPGNPVRRNLFFSNGDAAIRLVMDNPPAPPVITSAVSSDVDLTVTGSLTADPNTTVAVELFANTDCDPSGAGEGKQYLATLTLTTADDGTADWQTTLPAGGFAGEFVMATVTGADDTTSEFSACTPVSGPGGPEMTRGPGHRPADVSAAGTGMISAETGRGRHSATGATARQAKDLGGAGGLPLSPSRVDTFFGTVEEKPSAVLRGLHTALAWLPAGALADADLEGDALGIPPP